MKVRELLEQLKDVDPEFEVVMSSDAEGNNYSPLACLDVGHYQPESTWAGEWYNTEEGYAANAVCMGPTN